MASSCYKKDDSGDVVCTSNLTEDMCHAGNGFYIANINCDGSSNTATANDWSAGFEYAIGKALAKDAAATRQVTVEAIKKLVLIATS